MGYTPSNMDDDTAEVTTPTDNFRPRELNPVDERISTFLTARSGIYRELADLREEVSEPMTRDSSHTTVA